MPGLGWYQPVSSTQRPSGARDVLLASGATRVLWKPDPTGNHKNGQSMKANETLDSRFDMYENCC